MRKEAFKAGSEFPPCEPGKLRIYSMRFCPYAERALLVANAKNIPHEIVNINLTEKPSWYLEKNPDGTVPSLEQDGKVVCGSLVVADYLDEAYPGKVTLTPTDSYRKARDKMLVERFGDKVGMKFFRSVPALLGGDTAASQEVFQAMDWVEKELTTRGTPYFSGTRVGMVDYMIWPWLERIEALSPVPIPQELLPKLVAWVDLMRQDSAIQKTCVDPALLKRFFSDYIIKNVDYDMAL